LLSVPGREHRTFASDAVDVWRRVAHVATVVDACVVPTNVVSHDDENVCFPLTLGEDLRRLHDEDHRQKQ
jgi:hypothetical protein